MTTEEAKALAIEGDINAIIALGNYYSSNEEGQRDFDEALKWHTLGAEKGSKICMLLAAQLGNIQGRVHRKVLPDDVEQQLYYLNNALFWGKKALDYGEDAQNTINTTLGEIGITKFLASICEKSDTNNKILLLTDSITNLKSVYKVSSNPEVTLFLAFATYNYLNLTNSNDSSEYVFLHNLLLEITNNLSDNLTNKDIGIAYSYLGTLNTYGKGCSRDYDKAVHYYTLAGEYGFDCSDMLKLFKKKFFGGYTLA